MLSLVLTSCHTNLHLQNNPLVSHIHIWSVYWAWELQMSGKNDRTLMQLIAAADTKVRNLDAPKALVAQAFLEEPLPLRVEKVESKFAQ